jgi:hypothetical protein
MSKEIGHVVKRAAKNRAQKSAPALTALVGSLLLNSSSAVAQSAAKCTLLGDPQVSSVLVSLENRTTGSAYRRGERIHVILTLRAGAKGVYLPRFFEAFQQTCSYGFGAEVLTLDGRAADPNQPSCAYAGFQPKVAYVKLNPGETRTWSTALQTKTVAPGHYCLYAEYLSPEWLIGIATGLPEDRAMVAIGRITATPIPIEIR